MAAARRTVSRAGPRSAGLDGVEALARTHAAGAMTELARQAEALLYTRPTNLKHAAAAVVSYEKKLNGEMIR